MSESNDYKVLKKNLVVGSDRMDRIENTVCFGMPDINYCTQECESWIELKHPKEPVRRTTKLFGSNHKISRNQKNWFKRQVDAGGNAYFLIATNKQWMLINGNLADEINDMTVEQLLGVAIWTATKPVKKIMWAGLRKSLQMQAKYQFK